LARAMNVPSSPSLQPPGAGLPFAELLLARVGFAVQRRLMSPVQALKRFQTEAVRICDIGGGLTDEQAARVVVIPRIFGIEDSSRACSINMTIDHLVIVDELIIGLMEALLAGRTLPIEISTANVKPSAKPKPGVLERFAEVVEGYGRVIANAGSLKTAAKQHHPWFGPLDAHGWHCLAAVHHTIHRRQIERIMKGIGGVGLEAVDS